MCACFQKRTRNADEIINRHIEKIADDNGLSIIHNVDFSDLKITKEFNEHSIDYWKEWSIKLGFNGEINDDFRKKFLSVMKVRKNIRKEYWISILASTLFSLLYYVVPMFKIEYSLYFQIAILIFILISMFAILAYFIVLVEWILHDKKMMKEWKEKQCNLNES